MAIPTQPAQTLIEKIRSLPADWVAQVEDFVDSLKQREQAKQPPARKPLDSPVISVGKWPDDLSPRREEGYEQSGCFKDRTT